MTLKPVETLSQLVATASVNPMGQDATGPEFLESRLTEHLARLFDRLGLPYVCQSIEDGRENLIARLEGEMPPESGGRVILFDAHQDTVPVEGMTIDPWDPVVRQGRLYGRGACDTKGSMAAMLVAISRLAKERPPGMPTVLLSCTVNEEFGFTGAVGLTRLWTEPTGSDATKGIIPRRPDVAVVGEPTGLNVVVAHKGIVRWRVHTRGRAAHSALPEAGDNAVYKMARVASALEHYQKEVVGTVASHPLCGPATISLGVIRGGASVNTVPDECVIELDRRTPPGDDAEQARQHAIDYLASQPQIDFPLEHDPPFRDLAPLADDLNGPLADSLEATVRKVAGDCRRVGVAFGTHATFFAQAGVPAVVFGPGSIDQAHTKDEWISLDQLEHAAEVYYEFARSQPCR